MCRFTLWIVFFLIASAAQAGLVHFPIEPSDEDPFISVSFSLVGEDRDDGGILLRYKANGTWSAWIERPYDEHAALGLGKRFVSPYEVPAQTTDLQVYIAGTEGKDVITLHTYYPGKSSYPDQFSLEQAKSGIDSCDCQQPPIQVRSDWCPSGDCTQPSYTATTTTHLIVHHSAGSNTASDWAAVVRSIWNFHVNVNGWSDVGYNYLIDPNGVIYEGRGEDVVGAHFSCMNTGTMGVCFLGNFETANPSPAAMDALKELAAWKFCKMQVSGLDTSFHTLSALDLAHISGHRDGNASTAPASCASGTVCPGANLYSQLPALRNETHNHQLSCNDTLNSDIVVLSMDYRVTDGRTNPFVDQDTWLRYAIGNVGDTTTSDSVTIYLEINGNRIDTLVIPPLANGGSYSDSLLTSFNTLGNQSFCVYVEGAANEISVLNNSFCITIETIECTINASTNLLGSAGVSFECDIVATPNDTSVYTYTWLLDGVPLAETSYRLSPVPALGQYRVVVSNGFCSDTSTAILVDTDDECVRPSSLENTMLAGVTVTVMDGQLHIDGFEGQQDFRVQLLNLLGQAVWNGTGRGGFSKEVGHHPSGLYFVQVSVGEGQVVRQIVIP